MSVDLHARGLVCMMDLGDGCRILVLLRQGDVLSRRDILRSNL